MKKTRTTSTNKTQAALRLELFERMFHALPVGVLACSTTGINTYANAEAVRLLGCDFADPLPAADLVASFDLRTAGRDEPYPSEHFPVSRALAGERHRVDDVIAVVNGEPIPLEVRGVPLWSEVDGVTDALAVLVDIRTRGQSAADLRNLEARWHALSATLPEIGFILDEDGRYLEVVASRKNLLYAEAARVQNRLLHEVFPKAEADLFLSYVRRTLEAGALQEVEYELDVPKGRRWFEARLAPVQQPIEGRRAVVMVARDITERHQAETAFRQSEQKYRSLFEESKDGVYFSSSDGRLLDINPAGVELFGYDTREELLHVDVAEALYAVPDERKAFVEAMERDGHVRDYEIRSKTKSGEKLVLLVRSSAEHDEHGQIRGYRGIIRDITAYSRPGAGATFTIYLPRMEGSPVRKSRRRETPLHGSEHILFIDDQEMIVEMGKKLLQNFGYRVTATTDPEAALQRFTNSPDAFDLVITDLSMPALNGRELAEKLQKIQRKPIILMTGFREENLLDTSTAFNIRAILPKPFAALELSKTIRQVLDEKQENEHHG